MQQRHAEPTDYFLATAVPQIGTAVNSAPCTKYGVALDGNTTRYY